MQALFTGGLGDFIGAECFMTEQERDSVTTVLWATRNVNEIKAAFDLKWIFPNMKEDRELYTDWSDIRPTRPWQPGDRFMNIGMKHELNTKCGLNLSKEELDAISDHSLDATLQNIFQGKRRWISSRIGDNSVWPDVSKFNLPDRYVVIHPWSDAEINGREFNDADWDNILRFLARNNIKGVVVNQSTVLPPVSNLLIDLTNQTTLKESFGIIDQAESCILCASSLACYATKIFPKNKIWLKGGHDHMFSDWATIFYHGPFSNPRDVIFKNFDMLGGPVSSPINAVMFDQGYMSLV